MPIAVEHTVHAIAAVVQTVPVGTNIALLHLLWVMLNGSFLCSGKWEINELLDNWQLYVASENLWRVRRHERYQAVRCRRS